MAQPQQQYTMPPRQQYSPPQSATSPSVPQPQFQFPQQPPIKRQRMSPGPPSQPGSPYISSPYNNMSPGAGNSSASASPHFATVGIPQGVYNTPYANGNTTNNLNMPQSQPSPQIPQYQNAQPQNSLSFNGPNQNPLAPNQNGLSYNSYAGLPQQTGTMGPPSKPADKPREEEVNSTDVLAGTGIDLREEEQHLLSGFTQFPPADPGSFYGAGPANTPGQVPNTNTQEEFHMKAGEQAWRAAAQKLAASRQSEINNPFTAVITLRTRAAKIASEHGLTLKGGENGSMGAWVVPEHDPRPVHVRTDVGPEGAITSTSGSLLGFDASLAEQIALMSLAVKYRLRTLLEDAVKLSKGRQTGSHGVIPEEWKDAGESASNGVTSQVAEGASRAGWESAVSPNPLKRSFSAANKMPTPVSDGAKTPTETQKTPSNDVVIALRARAQKERDLEEARLRKRAARAAGELPGRQSSVAPGTPGSVAPEISEKAPTKKEQSKKAQSKMNEAASHAAANVTTATFLGGGGGLFGKKKKYSWMMGGGSASGASTPGRIMTQGLPGTPGGSGPAAPEKLTGEPVRRLGQWREDSDKGKGIQLRDWVAVLEEDGRDKKALQKAYMYLDQSEPK
ncbi:hypothetical protein B0J14DRAFT_614261 [Halenospora varia]|nr:hypothetical protein B0J14DRAFT_614261 [Halenospora varia]